METPSATTSKVEEPLSALAELEKNAVPKVEDKPADAPKEEDKKPADAPEAEEYEISLSDKSPLTEKDLDEVVALAEKYKWSKEDTENYIAKKEEVYTRGRDELHKQAQEIIRKDKEKFLADPDFSGEKGKESLATIDLAVSKYGDQALKDFLKGPGGNNIPIAKFLLKIGNLMKQDTFHGKGTTTPTPTGNSHEEMLKSSYPSFFKE